MRLFLRYASPVKSIVIEPAAAVTVYDDGRNAAGLHGYTLHGNQWGRSRLVITYFDGTVQSIGYRTIKPQTQAIADIGRFLDAGAANISLGSKETTVVLRQQSR